MSYKIILEIEKSGVLLSRLKNKPKSNPHYIFWIDNEGEYFRVWHDDLEYIRCVKKHYVYKYIRQYNRYALEFLKSMSKLKDWEYYVEV